MTVAYLIVISNICQIDFRWGLWFIGVFKEEFRGQNSGVRNIGGVFRTAPDLRPPIGKLDGELNRLFTRQLHFIHFLILTPDS